MWLQLRDRPDLHPGCGRQRPHHDVDILGAVVVSGQDGSGTFIASFANNDQDDPATVESLTGGGDTAELEIAEFEPIEIPRRSAW